MSIRYSILGLLHYRDMHGYRIKKHIEEHFGHMWSINYGQIYPNLKKMSEEGLISMHEENCDGEKGPPRKRYSITETGRAAFQEWLLSSPEKQMLLRDPFLMRFVFLGFGDKERAKDLIDEQIRVYKAQLKKRKQNAQRLKRNDIYVNLMADLGIQLNVMILKWLEDAREKIRSGSGEKSDGSTGSAVV